MSKYYQRQINCQLPTQHLYNNTLQSHNTPRLSADLTTVWLE